MTYQWAVVGAGPAGIASVGQLIDHGIPAESIAWIDPFFSVGDFGSLWQNVPSNTKVKLFLKFLHSTHAFGYSDCTETFALNEAPRHQTCDLHLMVEPLQWVTHHLRAKVHSIVDTVECLKLSNRTWELSFKTGSIFSKNVILSMGSQPKKLSFPKPVIDLHDAMDKTRLLKHCTSNDTVAVFGSSHSAVLVLKNLVELTKAKIINFYCSPLRYAVFLDDWILFDDTGLKGPTAEWAREHLDGAWPKTLRREYSNEENIGRYLPDCTKVIYAVGFERRLLPKVQGLAENLPCIDQIGIIAPGLFGVGIAFPEKLANRFGIVEHRVGLWKFMDYLQRVMPIWLKYGV